MPSSRRAILRGALALASSSTFPASVACASRVRFVGYPFRLGVASGYPTPSGFSLWTRLAPAPLAVDGGMIPEPVRLQWEVAQDEGFGKVVARGSCDALAEHAHSVHVDVEGLEPGRWYFYRLIAGEELSPTGRSRTAEAPGRGLDHLKIAFGSCQHFEHGWYVAHRHLADESPDLMIFLGDYLYESSWGEDPVRRHEGGIARTLADYRIRHAQTKTDPDLQRLHGCASWAMVWDDHEVSNDWAGDQAEDLDPDFVARYPFRSLRRISQLSNISDIEAPERFGGPTPAAHQAARRGRYGDPGPRVAGTPDRADAGEGPPPPPERRYLFMSHRPERVRRCLAAAPAAAAGMVALLVQEGGEAKEYPRWRARAIRRDRGRSPPEFECSRAQSHRI